MREIEVSRDLEVPVQVAWSALSDLASHPTWMKDAVALEFTTGVTSGVGTTMDVKTKVGPFQTTDVIEVTGWEEGSHIDVIHRGLVTGTGRLSVRPANTGSRIIWTEQLTFPWWVGGRITAMAARPILERIWAGNLSRFAEQVANDR